MERRVIHLNIADFAVAVERLTDSSLKTKPLLIATPTARAMVYDMSEEAFQAGVRKGMPLVVARRLCPGATCLPPHPERYATVMAKIATLAGAYTPLVERAGAGHLFLDVTGTHRLFGPAPSLGHRLRQAIRQQYGLEPIWTVAANKLVAKVASRLVKPVGEYEVVTGDEEVFLAPLPLALLPGLHPSDISRLREFNLTTMAQVAALSRQQLAIIHARRADFLLQAVRGIDSEPVRPPTDPRGILHFHHALPDDTNDDAVIRAALLSLTARAGQTLRSRQQGCLRLVIQLRYSDGSRASRQISVNQPISDDMTLQQVATTVLYRAWRRRVRLRYLTLICERLSRPVQQLSLFAATNKKRQNTDSLCAALDTIHQRFGTAGITRGRELCP